MLSLKERGQVEFLIGELLAHTLDLSPLHILHRPRISGWVNRYTQDAGVEGKEVAQCEGW